MCGETAAARTVARDGTDDVEHPDLVAQRIERYAEVVGAPTGCGIATVTVGADGIDPRNARAELRSLVKGAALVGGRA
ncbi:hypothetical protein [Pseudonocardia nigra]|uniref:hypothetical protein n=1 Tax=Pseudonocardia nigra TaxID=1921578 RepID=UPI001C5F3EA8|nr:hypothetical protein [Pseudonocardia nigra]